MNLEKFKGKKYVIWDWNGTLLDDLEYTVSVGNKLLKKNGHNEVDVKYYLDHFCFPVSEYYRKLGFNVDDKAFFNQLCTDFVGFYKEGVHTCDIKPEMRTIIKELDQLGVKQSVLSASEEKLLHSMIEQTGLQSYFEWSYGLSDLSATCKRERGKQLISKLNKYEKNEMLIVGDTLHDLEVGQDNGIDVLLVAHGHNSIERIKEKHDNLLIF